MGPTRRQVLQGSLIALAGMGACAGSGSAREDSAWEASAAHGRALEEGERSLREGAEACASDPYRPAYHFLPASRYLGDPNGLMQLDDGYHAFFQHFPFHGVEGGAMVPYWGHAVSPDLVHWERLPLALAPEPGTYDAAAIASGGAVASDDGPTIVYTSVPPQAQSLARSFDGGRTWRKYRSNPVVHRPEGIPGLLDGFRDPFVWREADRWLMVVGSGIEGVGGTVLLYSSADLLEWEFVGPLCEGLGPDHFQWECPSFFRLGAKWVLIVSPLARSAPGLRVPVLASVGEFDGRRFTPGEWRQVDLSGPDLFYAPNTLLTRDGRRILFGWALGGGAPGAPWQGMFTLPRELAVDEDGGLCATPAREVDTLRTRLIAERGPEEWAEPETWAIGRGRELDIVIDLAPGNVGTLRVEVLASAQPGETQPIELDFDAATIRFGSVEGALPEALRSGGEVRIFVDRSVIELYAAGTTLTARRYPPEGSDYIRLGGEARLRSTRVWGMEGIW